MQSSHRSCVAHHSFLALASFRNAVAARVSPRVVVDWGSRAAVLSGGHGAEAAAAVLSVLRPPPRGDQQRSRGSSARQAGCR